MRRRRGGRKTLEFALSSTGLFDISGWRIVVRARDLVGRELRTSSVRITDALGGKFEVDVPAAAETYTLERTKPMPKLVLAVGLGVEEPLPRRRRRPRRR